MDHIHRSAPFVAQDYQGGNSMNGPTWAGVAAHFPTNAQWPQQQRWHKTNHLRAGDYKARGLETTVLHGELEGLAVGAGYPNVDRKLAPHILAASLQGETVKVDDLLGRGAPIGARHKGSGATPLILAAAGGHQGVVELLLKSDANPGDADDAGATAAHAAALRGHVECLATILEGPPGGGEPLVDLVSAGTRKGETPLMAAAKGGHAAAVQCLLERGAHVGAVAEGGVTALMLACKHGKLDTMRALIAAGADVRRPDGDGKMAVHHAAYGGLEEAVLELLEGSGGVECPTEATGRTLLMCACEGGRLALARRLAEWAKNFSNP